MVGHELVSGRIVSLFGDELHHGSPPYTLRNSSFIAYSATAELACHLALDWPLPDRVLDLYVEFRNLTNGLEIPAGNGLLVRMRPRNERPYSTTAKLMLLLFVGFSSGCS